MIGKLSHRITWVLVAVSLAASVAADPYHPNILKSRVVTLDAAAIERNANSGTPFDLTFGDTTLMVVLAPAPLFPKEGVTFVEIAKGRQCDGDRPPRQLHLGEVLGDDPATTEVRLTIAGGVLEGPPAQRQGHFIVVGTPRRFQALDDGLMACRSSPITWTPFASPSFRLSRSATRGTPPDPTSPVR
ncbi:MAG TPA: hypothetical protein VEK57_03075 [Thermoanaerobaculia bacterium]|nr:hypothetical protein [Thermoanaerobaculia bacterium]